MSKLTVVLLGNELVTQDEDRKAAAAITPGMLLNIDSNGDWIPHATASIKAEPVFALEREELGNDMNDAYAINDTVKAGRCPAGVRVNALIASGQNVADGAYLDPSGSGGTFKVTASPATAVLRAREAVNNTAGPTAARCICTVL